MSSELRNRCDSNTIANIRSGVSYGNGGVYNAASGRGIACRQLKAERPWLVAVSITTPITNIRYFLFAYHVSDVHKSIMSSLKQVSNQVDLLI